MPSSSKSRRSTSRRRKSSGRVRNGGYKGVHKLTIESEGEQSSVRREEAVIADTVAKLGAMVIDGSTHEGSSKVQLQLQGNVLLQPRMLAMDAFLNETQHAQLLPVFSLANSKRASAGSDKQVAIRPEYPVAGLYREIGELRECVEHLRDLDDDLLWSARRGYSAYMRDETILAGDFSEVFLDGRMELQGNGVVYKGPYGDVIARHLIRIREKQNISYYCWEKARESYFYVLFATERAARKEAGKTTRNSAGQISFETSWPESTPRPPDTSSQTTYLHCPSPLLYCSQLQINKLCAPFKTRDAFAHNGQIQVDFASTAERTLFDAVTHGRVIHGATVICRHDSN